MQRQGRFFAAQAAWKNDLWAEVRTERDEARAEAERWKRNAGGHDPYTIAAQRDQARAERDAWIATADARADTARAAAERAIRAEAEAEQLRSGALALAAYFNVWVPGIDAPPGDEVLLRLLRTVEVEAARMRDEVERLREANRTDQAERLRQTTRAEKSEAQVTRMLEVCDNGHGPGIAFDGYVRVADIRAAAESVSDEQHG
jgi:hypothetical protein